MPAPQPAAPPEVPDANVPDRVVVTNTANAGPGSLQQAIVNANSRAGVTMAFNIPLTDPNFKDGVFTIAPLFNLPPLRSSGTVLDGATQRAFTGDTNPDGPEIVLKFTPRAKVDALLQIMAPNCTIKSLVLNGELPKGARPTAPGILIRGKETTGDAILGCYIGTDPHGKTALPNAQGIVITDRANHALIGGDSPQDRNVLSGNYKAQVAILGADASDNVVRGNYIGVDPSGNNAVADTTGGVLVQGDTNGGPQRNVIGGATPEARNIIVSRSENGQGIGLYYSDENVVEGNYIGTDKSGKVALAASPFGILVTNQSKHNRIGGLAPGQRNIIAGHNDSGISLTYCSDNTVQGNYIGTDAAGTAAIGNRIGVSIYAASGNLIGGAAHGAGNVISGNLAYGVWINGEEAHLSLTNLVQGNKIGTAADGTAPLGNGHVGVGLYWGTRDTVVGLARDNSGAGNLIANNGIGIDPATLPARQSLECIQLIGAEKLMPSGNTLRGNRVYNNGGLGINLVMEKEAPNTPTPNDANDVDGGPNNGQNYPVLNAAVLAAGVLTVRGILDSAPNAKFVIDFYFNAKPGAHNFGQGEHYLGSLPVTTDANGHVSFTFTGDGKLGAGYIAATATNLDNGDTSEFSQDIAAQAGMAQ